VSQKKKRVKDRGVGLKQIDLGENLHLAVVDGKLRRTANGELD